MKLNARRFNSIKCFLIVAFIGLYSLTILKQKAPMNFAPRVSAQTKQTATPEKKPERFDKLVRDDFFDGMTGDAAALDRGMKFCEEILAENPKHPDALVWHGGGLLARAANAYRRGDAKLGDKLWDQGIKEMNEAVRLAPDNIGILVGRSATLVGLAQSGWSSTDKDARALLESALLDYEKVYRIQEPYFGKIDEHNRGELLFGLASGWSILGEHEKARRYLHLVVKEVENTRYEKEARKWLDGNPRAVIQHDCFGCHAASY